MKLKKFLKFTVFMMFMISLLAPFTKSAVMMKNMES